MPQPVAFGPLQEFDNSHQFRTHPDTFLHLLSIQNFAPSGASGLRQIHERTFISDERLQLLVNHLAGCWHKSISHSGDIDKVLSAIVANNDGINSVRSRHVSPDNEFLPKIDAQL